MRISAKRLISLTSRHTATATATATATGTAARLNRSALTSFRSVTTSLRSAVPALSSSRFYSSTPILAADGEAQKFEFQAETRKLLDIVTNSIYTDKEVFLRELVSNASDSLEKLRYLQTTGNSPALSDDSPLEININLDSEKKTITISDNGIGMSKDELISNLGTIARSGSKQFVDKIQNSSAGSSRDGDGIIGQFGVGFYSSFMVSERVTVNSLSADSNDGIAHSWESDGSGTFTVNEVQATRGSTLTLYLKDTCAEFCDPKRIKEIVKKYSNFVSFPIKLDGTVVNTVSAIWTQDKNSVTEQQYNDFYKYIANAFDKPKYVLHFKADAPLDLKALLFFPTLHTEKYGMGRMEPGVNLYSRKIVIENRPQDLLPTWLRFMKGVVDSEDLPLSIAREKAQDSLLLKKMNDVLTRKILRFLSERLQREPEEYVEWYKEFHMFLKEGICTEQNYQEQLAKLLMYETSTGMEGEVVTLDQYISRCPPEQKNIYYLVAPDRKTAFASPYYETFKKHNREILFLYNTIDDFVMTNLKAYGGRPLKSAEDASIKLDDELSEEEKKAKEEADAKELESKGEDEKVTPLSETEATQFCDWLKTSLGTRVREVKVTHRLSDYPAIITDHESGAVRRMMRMVDQSNNGSTAPLPPQILHVNPKHPIIVRLAVAKDSNPNLASIVAEQLLDNALVAAGLKDDVRSMLPRLNEIISKALKE